MLGTVGLAVWLAGCADTSSGDSLEEQQEAQGWGAENCPATPQGVSVGFKLGDQLGELVLFDCAGEPVNLNALCGAEAAWLSFAHMWCPHCAKAASEMEAIHQSYVDAGHDLASVSIVVEDVSIERPDETDCSNWRDEHAQDRVVTLYDDDTDSFVLWEENLTNLNVLLTKERVIQSKIHSDREADIRAVIDRALE
jgi:thiol-disulfide isomerase/thioredoxin